MRDCTAVFNGSGEHVATIGFNESHGLWQIVAVQREAMEFFLFNILSRQVKADRCSAGSRSQRRTSQRANSSVRSATAARARMDSTVRLSLMVLLGDTDGSLCGREMSLFSSLPSLFVKACLGAHEGGGNFPLSLRSAAGILFLGSSEFVVWLRNGRTARIGYGRRTGIGRGPEATFSVLMGGSSCPARDRCNLVGGSPRSGKFCKAVFQPDNPTDSLGKLLCVPRPRSRRTQGRIAPGPRGIRLRASRKVWPGNPPGKSR